MQAKTYFHRTPGARFIFPTGIEISFAGGRFTTSDPLQQEELDKVANMHASQIYTSAEIPISVEEQVLKNELQKEATGAFDAANHIPPGASTIPMPVASDLKPTLSSLQSSNKGGEVTIAAAKAALAAVKNRQSDE